MVCLRASEWTVPLCRITATRHPCSRDSGCFSCPCAPHQLWGFDPFWAFLGWVWSRPVSQPTPGGQCPASCIHLNLSMWNHEFVVLRGLSLIPQFGSYRRALCHRRHVWPHLLPFLLVDCLGHTWHPLGSSGSESLNRSLSEVKVCRTWRAERQLSMQPLGAGERPRPVTPRDRRHLESSSHFMPDTVGR